MRSGRDASPRWGERMRFVESGSQPTEHTGMEFLCDFCGAQFDTFLNEGYYVYLDGFQFPSYWVCPGCKKDLERGVKIE